MTRRRDEHGNISDVASSSDEFFLQRSHEAASSLPTNGGSSMEFSTSSASSSSFGFQTKSLASLSHHNKTSTTNSTNNETSTRMLSPVKRKTAVMEELTINKLNFRFESLYGREAETNTLMNAFTKVKAEQQRQLVFISGYSGTGKTALANTLKTHVTRAGGMFARGKFDLSQRNKPYVGLTSACAELCRRVATLRGTAPDLYQRATSTIQSEVGTEIALLARVIPVLSDLLPDDHAVEIDQSTDSSSAAETKNSFLYAFRRLVRGFAKTFAPLVLVVDDLQWADTSSIDLFESLVTDRDCGRILLIGLFRSNEVKDHHILATTLRGLRTKTTEYNFGLQEIAVENLKPLSVHCLVRDVLSSTDQQISALAALCYKRTQGNVFFLLQFLTSLHDRTLLEFNFGTLKWTWDVDEIEQRTAASDNVVDLLRTKMESLSEENRELLQTAACFGERFNQDILFLVWKPLYKTEQSTESNVDSKQTEFTERLTTLVSDGYLEAVQPEGEYKFIHDKVQEAATKTLSPTDRHELCRRVGKVLALQLDQDRLTAAITLVVDLLNEGGASIGDSSISDTDLADLNRRACRQAMSIGAFEAAAEYARKGVALLGKGSWTTSTDYDLSLDLFSLGAESFGLLGRTDMMQVYFEEVQKHGKRSPEDKLRACIAYASSLTARGQASAAVKFVLALLKEFRVYFPTNKAGFVIQMIRGLAMAKSMTKRDGTEKLNSLPVDHDPLRLQLAVLLDKLNLYMYMCNDEVFPLVVFSSLQRTLVYGLNHFSPLAVAGTSIILAATGDLQGSAVFAKKATDLCRESALSIQCRVDLNCHGLVFHWTSPVRDSAKPLVQAYDRGLRSGETDQACYCILSYVVIRFVTNYPLEMLRDDIIVYARQFKELKQEFAYRYLTVYFGFSENLLGNIDSSGGNSLFCEMFPEDTAGLWREQDRIFYQIFVTVQGYLHTLMGDHERAAELALKEGDDALLKALPGSPLAYVDLLAKGLSCLVVAQQQTNRFHRRKFMKVANVVHKRIKRWISQGNPNVYHYEALFDAEFAALSNQSFAAISRYEAAVLLSARLGLLMDAGLCSERFGLFLLKQGKDEDARFRIEEAIRYYGEVGAHRKVDQLHSMKQSESLWPHPSEIAIP